MLHLFLNRCVALVSALFFSFCAASAFAESHEAKEEMSISINDALPGQIIASSDPSEVGQFVGGTPVNNAPSRVLVKVGELEITMGHVLIEAFREAENQGDMSDEAFFNELLNALVTDAALAQTVDEIPFQARIQIENEERFILSSASMALAADRILVTEEEVLAAYNEQYAEIDPQREYNASHILVETLDEAVAIIAELVNGREFEGLAMKSSIGPSGPSGGNLGWFGPGRMVPEFEEAVKGMEIGQTSPPIETEFGWHVIRLNDSRLPNVPAFDEVRETLREQIGQDMFNDALSDLISSVPIEPMDFAGIDLSILKDPMKAFYDNDDEDITSGTTPSN